VEPQVARALRPVITARHPIGSGSTSERSRRLLGGPPSSHATGGRQAALRMDGQGALGGVARFRRYGQLVVNG